MSLTIFSHAFIATFAMLFVIGPICMTVINTTVIYGFRIGIFAGLGVSVADTLYGGTEDDHCRQGLDRE